MTLVNNLLDTIDKANEANQGTICAHFKDDVCVPGCKNTKRGVIKEGDKCPWKDIWPKAVKECSCYKPDDDDHVDEANDNGIKKGVSVKLSKPTNQIERDMITKHGKDHVYTVSRILPRYGQASVTSEDGMVYRVNLGSLRKVKS